MVREIFEYCFLKWGLVTIQEQLLFETDTLITNHGSAVIIFMILYKLTIRGWLCLFWLKLRWNLTILVLTVSFLHFFFFVPSIIAFVISFIAFWKNSLFLSLCLYLSLSLPLCWLFWFLVDLSLCTNCVHNATTNK